MGPSSEGSFHKIGMLPPSQKEKCKTCEEMVKLMNEVGWPLIFHTDNVSEFCAKVIRVDEGIRDCSVKIHCRNLRHL